jgi:hypothetical protein
MPCPVLILCERTPRWATAWRRWADDGDGHQDHPRLVEVRSLAQCEAALDESPGAVVALAIDLAGSDRILGLLNTWRNRFARARVVVLASVEWRDAELALREAGAVHVVYSPRRLAATARLARRHFARQTAHEPAGALEEQIWNRLPWSRYAAAIGSTTH